MTARLGDRLLNAMESVARQACLPLRRAQIRGAVAFSRGQGRETCPYRSRAWRKAWLRGWDLASRGEA